MYRNSSWTSRNASTISVLMNIPGVPTFSHDDPCIMSVRERSAQIMPKNAIVTNETVEKRIALPISWVTRTHSLHNHRHLIPYVVVIIPLTRKAVFLILPSRKRKFLSEETFIDYFQQILALEKKWKRNIATYSTRSTIRNTKQFSNV
jgi:hypothetical protein